MNDGVIRPLPEKDEVSNLIFKPASWLTKIDFINRIILNNNVLISLLGKQGSGKTTFSRLMRTMLPSEITTFLMTANPLFERTVFLQQLGTLLGIESEPSLSNFIARINEKKSHVFLIIDDANHLANDFIEEILSGLKQQGDNGFFHICLVSNFSLVGPLSKLAQDSYTDMIHSMQLGPFTEKETKAYVAQHLLRLAGASKLMADDRIKQFHQMTQGNVVGINDQMVSFFKYKTTRFSWDDKLFRRVTIAASILFAAGTVGFLWQPNELVTELVSQEQVIPEQVAQVPIQLSDIPAYNVAAVRQAIIPTHSADIATVNSEDNLATELKKNLNEDVSSSKRTPVKKAIISTKSKQSVATLSLKSTVKFAKPTQQKHYTVQLLASHNINTLHHFAKIHRIQQQAKIWRMQLKGKPWYVLTLGQYDQRQQADQAVSHLSQNLVKLKPWVRTVSDLQMIG